ncbi:hypothetical protein ACO4BM_001277, partial [Escherichia coli]
VFLVILFTSFSGSLVSRISGAVQYSVSVTNNQNTEETAKRIASVMGFHVEEKYSKKEFWKTTKKLQSENCHLLRQSLLSMRKVIQMTQDYRNCSHYLKNSELS